MAAPSWAVDEIPPEAASGRAATVHSNHAPRAMVVAENPLAVAAGLAMLRRGGTAMDAAIAAQMVLNVVEPESSGIGGGGFLLYYDAAGKTIHYYNGREKAPRAMKEKAFLDNNGDALPFEDALASGISVGVPGLLKMLDRAHKEHGKLLWKELFEPAIDLAEGGFAMSHRLHAVLQDAPHVRYSPEAAALLLDERGTPKEEGSIIRNPALAATFHRIAEKGIPSFYEGDIAQAIVNKVRSHPRPGSLTLEDMRDYDVRREAPLCKPYRVYIVCSIPPPSSGGVALLEMLGMLEFARMNRLSPDSVNAAHLLLEAMRLAYADRNHYVADPAFVKVPVKQMLAREYLRRRFALIKPDQALDSIQPGVFRVKRGEEKMREEPPSTTHISIVDEAGNAVSMTTSIEHAFGSGLMVKGFLLNNQLTDFSFRPVENGVLVANRPQGGKQPRSSMTPVLVLNENGDVLATLGSPGGARIIPYVLQTLVGLLDWDMPMQEAINQPHVVHIGKQAELEKGTAAERLKPLLEAMGHTVEIKEETSGLHGIIRRGDEWEGGADPRRGGVARGY